MADFNVRSDSVNVEQIMDQIRARIRDKRGVDYTEEQIRELAAVKLEKFLDPRGVRSDLLEQFRRSQPAPSPLTVPLYPFEDTTLFDSHRGIVRFFRRLFRPVLKLFFNANALASSLHAQTVINRQTIDRLDAMEASQRQNGNLYYELLHNMVVELTRMTIEVKNAKMRVESIASRLEFNERRARALESVVVYKPAEVEPDQQMGYQIRGGSQLSPEHQAQTAGPQPPPHRPTLTPPQPSVASAAGGEGQPVEGPGQRSRRRRRRRGRRGGASAVALMQPTAAKPNNPEAPELSGGGSAEIDARATRPEPVEHSMSSAAHPAEERPDAPTAPAPITADRPPSDPPDNDQ